MPINLIRKLFRYDIRELAALTCGVAFSLAVARWLILRDDYITALFVASWAVGCIWGITITSRYTSVVWGAILGGSAPPVLLYLAFVALGTGTFSKLSLFFIWGFATLASAIQSVLMGIVGQGFTIRPVARSQQRMKRSGRTMR